MDEERRKDKEKRRKEIKWFSFGKGRRKKKKRVRRQWSGRAVERGMTQDHEIDCFFSFFSFFLFLKEGIKWKKVNEIIGASYTLKDLEERDR